MKKFMSILLSLALALLSAGAVFAEETDTERNGDFIYNKGTNEIVDYVGDFDNCVLPENVTLKSLGKNRGSITKITLNNNEDYSRLNAMTGLKEIVFGNGVSEIKENDVDLDGNDNEIPNLEKVTVLKGVKKIDEAAFRNRAITELDLSGAMGLEYIGDSAFYNNNLSGTLEIPENVKYIGVKAFATDENSKNSTKKSNFTKVILPENLETISRFSFGGYVETINYPTGLFKNPPTDFPCSKDLTFSVSLDEVPAEVFVSLRQNDWYNDVYLKSKSEAAHGGESDFVITNNVVSKYVGSDESVTVPEGVTGIAKFAFKNMTVRHVTLPQTLKRIERSAFYGCALEEITIPKSVEYIGREAFSGCHALKKITFEGTPEIEETMLSQSFSMLTAEVVFKAGEFKYYDEENVDSVPDSTYSYFKTPWGEPYMDVLPDSTYISDYDMTKAEYLKAKADGTLPEPNSTPQPTDNPDATDEPDTDAEPSATAKPTAAPEPTTAPDVTDAPKTLTVSTADGVSITVDGKAVDFPDAKPFIDDADRTQVPVRAVAEMLKCSVDWDDEIKTAVITRDDGKVIRIAADSDVMTVNGEPKEMDTAAVIKDDRTYIPLRFAAEALGLTVEWSN